MMDMNDLDMIGGIRNGTRAWIQKRKRKKKEEKEKKEDKIIIINRRNKIRKLVSRSLRFLNRSHAELLNGMVWEWERSCVWGGVSCVDLRMMSFVYTCKESLVTKKV